jgi:prepilin-type N-terminal cleavage/methylation domain-containing protein
MRAGSGIKTSCHSGLTLIEMMIVVVILSLLAGLAYPSALRLMLLHRESALKSTLFTTRSMLDAYYEDHGHYPYYLSDLVSDKYLRREPFDGVSRSYDWSLITENGISDIRSTSNELSTEGTRYSDW